MPRGKTITTHLPAATAAYASGKQAAKSTVTVALIQQSATVVTVVRTQTPLLMACQSSWKLGRGEGDVVCTLFRK